MNVIQSDAATQLIAIGLAPDEGLLESICDAVEQYDIRNGVVVSGAGTLKVATMHYIDDTDFPPTEGFFTLEKPLELVSISGIIADGQPHLHMVVSCRDEGVWAGHLEPGCVVAYLAEIGILKCNHLEMTRFADERSIKLLGPKGQTTTGASPVGDS